MLSKSWAEYYQETFLLHSEKAGHSTYFYLSSTSHMSGDWLHSIPLEQSVEMISRLMRRPFFSSSFAGAPPFSHHSPERINLKYTLFYTIILFSLRHIHSAFYESGIFLRRLEYLARNSFPPSSKFEYWIFLFSRLSNLLSFFPFCDLLSLVCTKPEISLLSQTRLNIRGE